MTIISKEITGTQTTIVKEYTDEFGLLITETSIEQHAVEYVPPLSSSEVNASINYYANILVEVYNGAKYSYLRHYYEYFEDTKFNKTNTPEQQAQADNIYSALLAFDI